MKLSFVITNEKASYVSKEDSICLFRVAKEAALNKQQIKPCVPFLFLDFYSPLLPRPYMRLFREKYTPWTSSC